MKINISRLFLLAFILFAGDIMAQKNDKAIKEKQEISKTLDLLNLYASKADFNNYFSLYAEESTFIGTDATEVWNKKQFMEYAKPHFDKGKAWTFKSVKRNITISKNGKMAWFDELLDTQMKICRGSGVLEKIGNTLKMRQYVLSITVPNEYTGEVVNLKKETDDRLLRNMGK